MKRTLILITLFIWGMTAHLNASKDSPKPSRFSFEVDNMIKWDAKNTFQTNGILFIGSSSIRMWKTREAFPQWNVQNRGFGGAHFSDVIHFYDKLVPHLKPAVIVIYVGDNDIDYGKSVNQVVKDYKTLINMIKKSLPGTRTVFVPIKPSPSRWSKWPAMQKCNKKIKSIIDKDKDQFYVDIATPMLGTEGKPDRKWFKKDLLHLSPEGYKLWNKETAKVLAPLVDDAD